MKPILLVIPAAFCASCASQPQKPVESKADEDANRNAAIAEMVKRFETIRIHSGDIGRHAVEPSAVVNVPEDSTYGLRYHSLLAEKEQLRKASDELARKYLSTKDEQERDLIGRELQEVLTRISHLQQLIHEKDIAAQRRELDERQRSKPKSP